MRTVSARDAGKVVPGASIPWWYASDLEGVKRLVEQHAQALARVEATICGLQRRLNIVQEKSESSDALCKERIAKVEEVHARNVTSCTEVKEGLDDVTGHVAEVASGLESLAGCFIEFEGLLNESKLGKPRRQVHLPHLEKAKSKLQPGFSAVNSRGMREQAGLAVTSSEKTKVRRRHSLKESTRDEAHASHPGADCRAETPRGRPGRSATPGGSPSASTRNPDSDGQQSDGCTDTSPPDTNTTWADMSSASAEKMEEQVPSNDDESPEPSSAECRAERKADASSRSSSRTLSPPVMIEEFTFSSKPSNDLSNDSSNTSEPKQEDNQSEPPGSYVIWVPSCGRRETGNYPRGQSESPSASVPSESPKGSGVTRSIPQRVSSTPASLAETAQELTRREASPSVTHTEISQEHPRQEVWRKVRPSKQESRPQVRWNCGHSSGSVATVSPIGQWSAFTQQPQQPRQAGISRSHVYGQQRRFVCQRPDDAGGASSKSKAPSLRIRSMPPLGTASRNGGLVVRSSL